LKNSNTNTAPARKWKTITGAAMTLTVAAALAPASPAFAGNQNTVLKIVGQGKTREIALKDSNKWQCPPNFPQISRTPVEYKPFYHNTWWNANSVLTCKGDLFAIFRPK
jgi:hypothetical protein